MTDQFKVRYEVEDGYAGGSRPQEFSIDSDWFADDASDEDLEEELDKIIEEDFRQRISWYCNNRDEVLAWARAKRDEMAEEDAE